MLKKELIGSLAIVAILIFAVDGFTQSIDCKAWKSQVDASMKRQGILTADKLTSEQKIEGIECLLTLESEDGPARFRGATRIVWERSLPTPMPKNAPPISIAALYYISYLFTDDWGHGNEIVLYDTKTDKPISLQDIPKAFQLYKQWWQKVKAKGFEEARKLELDPFENSDFRW